MRTRIQFVLLAAAVGFACPPGARAGDGLDIYLIRHAETMGNVTGDYSETNQRTFSPKGLEQVAALPGKLEAYCFDHILVSPAWRTQQTILAYLVANSLQAEVWPELEEVDCTMTGGETPAAAITMGEVMQLVDTNAFRFREPAADHHCQPANPAEALTQLQRAIRLIRKRFGGSGQSILLVGHSCSGSRLAELLLGLKAAGRFAPANTALFHIRQDSAGRGEMLVKNDAPPTFFDRFLLTDGPEFPVPGFLNLAGTWKILEGDDPAWSGRDVDESGWKRTSVPGGWERDALPVYDGTAWYRLHFDVAEATRASWGGKEIVLLMGAIDDADETFLNGTKVGAAGVFAPVQETAWDQPRLYRFPADLLGSNNVLAVRVSDWGGGGGIWRAPVAVGPADEVPADAD